MGLLVLLSLVLITVAFRSSALDGAQGAGATALRPFEAGANRVARPFRDAIGWFRGLISARDENKKLRERNATLEQALITDEGAVQEDVQLRAALNYRGPPSVVSFGRVSAAVLADPQSGAEETVTITAGSNSGIKTGDVVVEPTGSPDGAGVLVGTVDVVTHDVSRVMLLTDGDSAVTATDVTNPTVIGVVRWGASENTLILDRVPMQPVVKIGDTIITLGSLGDGHLKSRYPRGIPIGTVTSIGNNDAAPFQNVGVTPLVDLSSIRSVIVLTPQS